MAGKTRLQEPTQRRARAVKIIADKMSGKSVPAIAKELHLSTRTVQDIAAWARKQGIIEQVEAALIHESLPLINRELKKVLNATPEEATTNSKGYGVKVTAATNLAKGLGIFKSHKAVLGGLNQTVGLDEYLKRRAAAVPAEPVIDADVVVSDATQLSLLEPA